MLGEIDSLLHCMPNGVVDQMSITAKYAMVTDIFFSLVLVNYFLFVDK